MNMIDVTIVAWPNHPKRLEYCLATVAALKQRLTAARHALRYRISAESERDQESQWCGDALQSFCDQFGIPIHWQPAPSSLGGSMNRALCLSEPGAPTFLVQDDWVLLEPLDLSDGADVLELHLEIDMIRYSYCIDARHPTAFTDEVFPRFKVVNIDGPWPYGDDPQLRTSRMTERHGWYRDDVGMASEGDMLIRLQRGRARILAAQRNYFAHLGEVSAVPVSKETRERAVSR